jgi:hypothetical protein
MYLPGKSEVGRAKWEERIGTAKNGEWNREVNVWGRKTFGVW